MKKNSDAERVGHQGRTVPRSGLIFYRGTEERFMNFGDFLQIGAHGLAILAGRRVFGGCRRFDWLCQPFGLSFQAGGKLLCYDLKW
jgi:hypothetical protein